MENFSEIHAKVKAAAALKLLFLPHAVKQMSKLDRLITPTDVRAVLLHGEVIEDYPEDARGHSALLMGNTKGRAIHLVCSPKPEYLAIITAYIPDPTEWDADLKRRIKP